MTNQPRINRLFDSQDLCIDTSRYERYHPRFRGKCVPVESLTTPEAVKSIMPGYDGFIRELAKHTWDKHTKSQEGNTDAPQSA